MMLRAEVDAGLPYRVPPEGYPYIFDRAICFLVQTTSIRLRQRPNYRAATTGPRELATPQKTFNPSLIEAR